jgi:hypothetical protein
VTILSGSHRNYTSGFPINCQYIHHAVTAAFDAHDLCVRTRLGMDPDDDLVFASSAAYFAGSGGGYSMLLEQVALHGGARLVTPTASTNFGWQGVQPNCVQ